MRKNYSILAVDDNELNLAVLTDALKDGYELLIAGSGQDAIEIATAEAPDLILLDVMMPEMDGFDVCRQLKANPLTRSIPIIFLSGRDDVRSKTLGFECGGVDYITKPFEVLEVKARVELHLELMRARRALERQNQYLEERVQERTLQIREIQRARYESLNNLADAVAHQVRNPVVAIGGITKLLMRKHPPGQSEEGSERDLLLSILDEALRLEDMVRAVSDFTALTVHEKNDVDVVHAVEKAREQALNAVKDANGHIQLDVSTHPLRGEQDTLTRGVRELIINALESLAILEDEVRFSRGGGRVLVTGSRMGTTYRIEVTDNGPGIAEDLLPFVTDPFFTTKSVGVGMGLAMAQRVAEEHDGTLRIESGPTGTRAVLEFPV